MQKYRESHKFERYIFGLLLAAELILSFTFLGYVHIPPISITTAYIPIVVCACLFGPGEATAAGLLFGLGSLYKASASYVMPADKIFSPFQSDFPFGSVMLSVGSRVVFGFLLGWLFLMARESDHQRVWKPVIALAAPKLHAVLVYGAMGLFFPEYGFSARSALHWEKSDVVITLACAVIVLGLDRLYNSTYVTKFRQVFNEAERPNDPSSRSRIGLGIVGAFILSVAGFSTVYFAGRMKYMLNAHGVDVTDSIWRDTVHLQVQFLTAMLALDFILMLLIQLVYHYLKYREYQGELDYLTGVMGRKLFLNYCTHSQKNHEGLKGWFLFLDVDYFKSINDRFGHLVGDETLRRFADCLKTAFCPYGAVGRVGGDEFAVLIEQSASKVEMAALLAQFLQDIAGILQDTAAEVTVSCSIGAYRFVFPQDLKHLLTETDRVLYEAKENGRARFVIEDSFGD